jgi:D-alanyl-D-alanine carboxypeptidase
VSGIVIGVAIAIIAVWAVIAVVSATTMPDSAPSNPPPTLMTTDAPATDVPVTEAPSPAITPAASPAAAAGFNKTAHSTTDPTSIWAVVDKLRPIPNGSEYVPPDLVATPDGIPNTHGHPLRQMTTDAIVELFAAAKAEAGFHLVIASGYRSYSSQTFAYNGYVSSLGQTGADATSARPGFSEHQTGMAADILDTASGCGTEGACFGNAPAGQWLAANAWRYGFILRYPADKTPVTGYEYEPWHFRYVGTDLAAEMHTEGVTTLEEFFGLPAAPTY